MSRNPLADAREFEQIFGVRRQHYEIKRSRNYSPVVIGSRDDFPGLLLVPGMVYLGRVRTTLKGSWPANRRDRYLLVGPGG